MNNISLEFIRSLHPCENRLNNFIFHYPNYSGSVEDFLNLTNISYRDKLWVVFHTCSNFLTLKQKRELACNFAEHVLHFFEDKYPNDDRPRKAIAAARSGDKAAAYAARDAAAAAHAAAHAAAYAARDAAAAHAAAAHAAAYAADYAAAAANNSGAAARELERKYQIDLIKQELTK